MDRNQKFQVLAEQQGDWVSFSNFRFFWYQENEQNCPVKYSQAQKKLEKFDQQITSFYQTTGQVIPNFFNKIRQNSVYVAFDDMQKQNFIHPALHLRNTPNDRDNLILIDCETLKSDQWISLLAHELVHVILSKSDRPIWAEEMLAQYMEFRFNSKSILKRPLETFSFDQLPSPISEDRPFTTIENYQINFLWMKYLVRQYGESVVVESILDDQKIPSCNTDQFGAEELLCRIEFLHKKKNFPKRTINLLSLDSLVVSFWIALHVNVNDAESDGFYLSPEGGQLSLDQASKNENPGNSNEKGRLYRKVSSSSLNPLLPDFNKQARYHITILRSLEGYEIFEWDSTQDLQPQLIRFQKILQEWKNSSYFRQIYLNIR